MKCLASHNLTQGWQAHYFSTGEMVVNNTSTGEILSMPRDSVNTLIRIIDEIKQEKETSS